MSRAAVLALALFGSVAAAAPCPTLQPQAPLPEGTYVVVGSSAKVKNAKLYTVQEDTVAQCDTGTVYGKHSSVKIQSRTVAVGTPCDCSAFQVLRTYCAVPTVPFPAVARCGVRK